MKFAKVSGTLGLLGLAVIASPFDAAAQTGWYGGFSVGQSDASINEGGIRDNLLGAGFTSSSVDTDETDTGFKIFGGYQFTRHIAVEAGYFDLGRFKFSAITVPAGSLDGRFKVKGVNLDVVGIMPFTEKFSAFGRLGVQYAETKASFSPSGAVFVADSSPSERDTNYKFGVGLQYDFTPFLGMRAEAERYRIHTVVSGRDDVDLYSIGLVFRFGGKTPAPAPVSQPVVAPPPPAKVVTPPPPPPPKKAAPPPPPPREVVSEPPPPPPPAPARKDRN